MIEEALRLESWLPLGLRSLLASEIPWIRRLIQRGHSRRAFREIHRLVLSSFQYRDEVWDSEAVAQLRILDLELGQKYLPVSEEMAGVLP